jgi:hypothetical protein
MMLEIKHYIPTGSNVQCHYIRYKISSALAFTTNSISRFAPFFCSIILVLALAINFNM